MFNFFQRKEYLDYKDVLILPRPTTLVSRQQASIENTYYTFPHCEFPGMKGVPIIVANMDTTGTFEMAKKFAVHEMYTALHKHYSANEIIEFFKENKDIFLKVFVTIGTSQEELDKLESIHKETDILLVNVDIANGYSPILAQTVEKVRAFLPHAYIMTGNIATAEGVKPLAEAGANIIKVGIGPGGQCRTRETAGVGVPQVTAVQDCAKAAKRHNVLICADGGIQEYADFSKAYAAGADFVMVGSMFAAHDESGGDVVYDNDDKPFKEIYGMSSEAAMVKYSGGVAKYRASEGRHSLVPLRGPVEQTILNVLGSIRSTCTYTNSYSIRELKRNAKLIKVRETINRKYEQYTIGI